MMVCQSTFGQGFEDVFSAICEILNLARDVGLLWQQLTQPRLDGGVVSGEVRQDLHQLVLGEDGDQLHRVLRLASLTIVVIDVEIHLGRLQLLDRSSLHIVLYIVNFVSLLDSWKVLS